MQRSELNMYGCTHAKTTVFCPFAKMRRSDFHLTALARTRASMSAPILTRSFAVCVWLTFSTACSIIGPSSRSAVTR